MNTRKDGGMKEIRECMAKYEKLGREAAYLLGHSPEDFGIRHLELLGYHVRIRTGIRKPMTVEIASWALVEVVRELGGVR